MCLGSENALQRFEFEQRCNDNLIRRRAMRDLGEKGVFANETEIARWREDLVQRELEARRSHHERHS